jgi:hypothetical protein
MCGSALPAQRSSDPRCAHSVRGWVCAIGGGAGGRSCFGEPLLISSMALDAFNA